MGRKKSKPHRSGGIILETNATAETELDKQNAVEGREEEKGDSCGIDKPYFVEVDRTGWLLSEHLDISEVVLGDLNLREEFSGFELSEDFYRDPQHSLRFRVCNVNNVLGRIKLGHWPVLPCTDIHLEFVTRDTVEQMETYTVLFSGIFDGPDEGVTGLLHLASLKFVTLRPVLGVRLSDEISSIRVRVEVLKSAFDACESLLENSRQLWKKSMMNVMSWLRPEIMTSEVRYGFGSHMEIEVDPQTEMADETYHAKKHSRFDPAGFYEAIKPSKAEPMLEDDMPELLPKLRPYQRRAAFWMVEREKAVEESQGERERNQFHSPLSIPVDFLDTSSQMFFNPFSGNISLCPETSSPYVFGGILADEMGLGKTVELLACIFAHRRSASGSNIFIDLEPQINGDQKVTLKRLKRERVECICGAVSESLKYEGLWVQCDICDAWQHADCVGYSLKGKSLKSKQGCESKTYKTTIAVRDGEYVCQMCSELIQATESPIASGATLIVCPAPILPQWHDEILRHTHQDSLKTCVYEGVRDTSLSNTSLMDISDLASADIVLTTYDVLKEDLTHDSDRHEGDRHVLRFQKRYPVIPTLLTRIYWWRVCLDEAQMVESNATAATGMALRLHSKYRWCITGTPIQRKLDDLYGLLRFLKASPFDTYRWWTDVIRDPYEKGDAGAMEFTHKIFKQIMWRSSKEHVADELDLPSQDECLSWLTLSPVEEHFYQRQHETCVRDAHEVIESLRNDILNRKVPDSVSLNGSSDPLITHTEAGKLLNALLKLRQACCHPQVGSSGLRSMQQTPMTMEEILMVLISKTKIEGEEALRKLVIALNALAAIAAIQKDFSQATLLYSEALTLAEEHSEDFRLDPLLNIHIHHNLAEILPLASNFSSVLPSKGKQFSGFSEFKTTKRHLIIKVDHCLVKRQKLSGCDDVNVTVPSAEPSNIASSLSEDDLNEDQEFDNLSADSVKSLIAECEDSKQKYLSVFSSKLSAAQLEFQNSYTQVCNAHRESKTDQNTFWWLEALHYAEQNKDFSTELIRKIEEAISGTSNNSKSSRIAARFRSISSLKYQIQTGLDHLEASRKTLLDRLLDIDQTMEKPKEEDIERVGKCRNCQPNCDGPPCVLCELDELFQDYEARLFVLKNERGGIISSAEEAVDFQKKTFALNHFLSKLSQSNHSSTVSDISHEESKKRNVGQRVVVSRSASELELILGVIRNCCKGRLGRDSVSAATKHLHIFEGMRKEFGHARSLALAQAQYLRAHDEIKMAVSRLHLRASEDDKSLDALGENELSAASSNFSHDKFMSLTMLSQIKGKLRYLKGLVQSKQKLQFESPNGSSFTRETTAMSNSTEEKGALVSKTDDETCPICQEKLGSQKMVFQCGHLTCCKCLFAMTEQRLQNSKLHNWVMCPTCRQHTDFGNIAYAVDAQNESSNSSVLHTIGSSEKCEASISVKGSYGTKIEAVTRRILWVKANDHRAKVLVFSSWNDVLDVLEHAFAANNITYIRMKGGRKAHVAISQFRGKQNGSRGCEGSTAKSIQVLLLLIQHGANGLNLLEAEHVVLVEPLLNPAAEAQAISRVHRIGQKNKTLIHRFIVKDTVEESIYKLNRSRSNHSFISGNTKNQDQPVLTLKDVEALLSRAPLTMPESDENTNTNANLRHLPPSVAAAIAAERRLNEQST
ncbi:E3 ubiquitin-protein ligase SHPRH [Cajanus cajan]|uniref:E3 ubiquitin-protein ligase SHPRH n=1 Tax=Cajanus cajan TaxID=3821 RepID=UPI00098DC082|nr:E3 ubiquitin-protein ligase SHPRH [Cajanus cajan]XP_020226338.1 E3 ubiquitin-protein ligase SHPRH [Cajanus cajan]XP_020226347.1 E3 ubiquitin-protein ligase SHPRH [Cajanus cajan]XP_020226354.1 E3 ubiquitin-protein ligase SHPRH [Cajanus cajan]XP_020226364.1 E3 ubiquitin-protein ligase SHPRH [Cajanus cajan]